MPNLGLVKARPPLGGGGGARCVWAGLGPRTNSTNKDNLDLRESSIVAGELILPAAEFWRL